MKVDNLELEHSAFYREGQSTYVYRETYTYGKHKLRVTLRQNSYDFQSSYYIEVWAPEALEWHRVHSLPYQVWWKQMPSVYAAKSELDLGETAADMVDELITYTQMILEA